MKITCFADLDVLYYGIYAATYPGSNTFDVTCSKCKHKNKVSIAPEHILTVEDKEAGSQVRTIINGVQTSEEVFNNSQMKKIKRIAFKKRKIILDMKIPSLQDNLDILREFNNDIEEMVNFENVLTLLMHIKAVYVPDVDHFNNTGEVRFVELDSLKAISKVITDMDEDEENIILEAIEEMQKKYAIRYEIPIFNCKGILLNKDDATNKVTSTSCGNKIGPLSLDMEQLVFHHIAPKG